MRCQMTRRSDKGLNYTVSASILSADLAYLGTEIKRAEKSGVDMLHFDVMDGIFVDNITYGLPVLSAVRKITDMTIDVHLMITDPLRYAGRFAEAGADIISFHLESGSDPVRTLDSVRSSGARPAIAIKPGTPVESVYEYIPLADMILVMTVEPGFGGQSFLPGSAERIRKVRNEIRRLGLDTDVQVDGGIDSETADIVRGAGANVLVSGSFLFGSENMAEAVSKLKGSI